MFYSKFILSSTGALSVVWHAAHWEVKKQVVNETQIDKKVQYIIQPQVPIALRTGGHLLVGVVKIYSKKAKYLLNDCSDALSKIKVAFRPGAVDLPPNQLVANVNAITISDKDIAFSVDLPVVDFDRLNFDLLEEPRGITAHEDDITLRERDVDIALGGDMGGLDDMEIELGRDAMVGEEAFRPEEFRHNMSIMSAKGVDTTLDKTLDADMTLEQGRGLLDDQEDFGMNAAFDDQAGFDAGQFDVEMDFGDDGGPLFHVDEEERVEEEPEAADKAEKKHEEDVESEQTAPATPPQQDQERSPIVPGGFANDDEALVNAPLPELEARPLSQKRAQGTQRPKRRVGFDEKTQLTNDEIKQNLRDASELVRPRPRTAKTRRQVLEQEVEARLANTNFFHEPAMLFMVPELAELIKRNLTTGPPVGVPAYSGPAEEEGDMDLHEPRDRLASPDITADQINITVDTLPPMEEELEEEDRASKRARFDEEPAMDGDFQMDFGDDGLDLGLAMEMPEMGVDHEEREAEMVEGEGAEEEEEDVFDFTLSQMKGKEVEEEALVPADDLEMKSRRTQKMLKNLKTAFGKKDEVMFLKTIVKGKDKRTAAAAMFEILALKTRDYIDVQQTEPFGDVLITKTAKFVGM